LEEQLQEALGAKAVLETDIKTMQALPVRIRDLEVALAKKEREMSLLQATICSHSSRPIMQHVMLRIRL
jgi:hypothetical protein